MMFYAFFYSFVPSLARGGLALYLLGWALAGCTVLSQPARQDEEAEIPIRQAEQHLDQGLELARQKKYAEAEAAFREAVRLNPSSVFTLAMLAESILQQHRYAEGETVAREALRLDPKSGLGYLSLGSALSKQPGKNTEAEAALREAIRLIAYPDPRLGIAYGRLGAVMGNQRRFAEAEKYFREAIRIRPSAAVWYEYLGRALENQEKHAEAEIVLREGLQIATGPYKHKIESALERILLKRQADEGSPSKETPRTLSEERAELERERQRLEEERERLARERAEVERREAEARREREERQRAQAERQRESQPKLKAQGSGFLLKHSALVLTAAHVVDTARTIAVRFPDGAIRLAKLLSKDLRNDLAVLRLKDYSPSTAGFHVNPLAALLPGQRVYVLGYPLAVVLSQQPSIVPGIISSLAGARDDPTRFRMTAPLNPGNSGGPILNDRGEVVGIAVAAGRPDVIESMSFGIKVSTVLPILKQIEYKISAAPEELSPKTPPDLFQKYSPAVVLILTSD